MLVREASHQNPKASHVTDDLLPSKVNIYLNGWFLRFIINKLVYVSDEVSKLTHGTAI